MSHSKPIKMLYFLIQVDVFQMSVIEVLNEAPGSPPPSSDPRRRSSVTMMNAPSKNCKAAPSSQFYHIERYMDGEYRKYNSNSGYVDGQLRNTPQVGLMFKIAMLRQLNITETLLIINVGI